MPTEPITCPHCQCDLKKHTPYWCDTGEEPDHMYRILECDMCRKNWTQHYKFDNITLGDYTLPDDEEA